MSRDLRLQLRHQFLEVLRIAKQIEVRLFQLLRFGPAGADGVARGGELLVGQGGSQGGGHA